MGKASGKLTVYFEEPLWVGVFERIEDGKLSVAKFTFGAEPKDYEVYEFVLEHYYNLEFSPEVKAVVKSVSKNPKKVQREIIKQMSNIGIGTKSQQALKSQQDQNRVDRKAKSKEKKEAEAKYQFELKQQKRKEKRRGR